MVRKFLLLIITVTVPSVLFLNVRQVYKYNQIHGEVSYLIESQRELFEKNKRMVANLSILSSPERIDGLAKDILNLQETTTNTIRIELDSKKESLYD